MEERVTCWDGELLPAGWMEMEGWEAGWPWGPCSRGGRLQSPGDGDLIYFLEI